MGISFVSALCTAGILSLFHFINCGTRRLIFFLDTFRFIGDIKAAISDYRGLARLLSSRWPIAKDVQEIHDVFFSEMRLMQALQAESM